MMTTIMVGMQNSILVVNSSNEYETQESLKETNPQSIPLETACGKLMMMVRLGVILEKMLFPVLMLCLLQLVL